MFLRDKNYFPSGCLAISVDRSKQEVKYQLSVLNPKDRFDRSLARSIALGRLVEKPVTISVPNDATMHQISEAVMRDIVSGTKVPARAVKSAKLWLYWTVEAKKE